MTKTQLETLLLMYKKAVIKNLTAVEFAVELQRAKIEIDKSFVSFGKEDENLGQYIEELNLLSVLSNE